MKYDISSLMFTAALAILVSGCAHQQMGSSDGSFNPFCALVGAAAAGGGAAALGAAAGPIGAGVFVGAMLGSLACAQDNPPVQQPVATTVAPQAAPPPAPMAAPELDSDGDGVVDRLDRCPGTPPGTRVNANGCPDILLTLTGINFKFDSSVIEPASEQILQQAVQTLNEVSAVDIRIVGHTDSVGSDAYNQALSQRRADAVQAYLINRGIAASRLSSEGMGESMPVAPNDTDEGRYQNRRVELHVDGSSADMSSSGQSSTTTSSETWRSRDHQVTY